MSSLFVNYGSPIRSGLPKPALATPIVRYNQNQSNIYLFSMKQATKRYGIPRKIPFVSTATQTRSVSTCGNGLPWIQSGCPGACKGQKSAWLLCLEQLQELMFVSRDAFGGRIPPLGTRVTYKIGTDSSLQGGRLEFTD